MAPNFIYSIDSKDLRPKKFNCPQPKNGEILVQVLAFGLNNADILQHQGRYPPPDSVLPILGLELAGKILAGDLSKTPYKIGDTVCALVSGGAFATHVLVNPAHCILLPPNLSALEGAGLMEALLTVWSHVYDRVALKTGESFLVHGASGAVGHMAVQMGIALGQKVLATARGAAKVEFCKSLGAFAVFDLLAATVSEDIQNCIPQGVDVILDMVGGDLLSHNLDWLAVEGRLVQIGVAHAEARINLQTLYKKRLTLTGATLRNRSDEYKTRMTQTLKQHVWKFVAQRKIVPRITATFAFDQVDQAFARFKSKDHFGKIIVSNL